MGEYSFLLAITIVFIFGTLSPGPSFILVAKTAVSKPFSEGIAVAIGLSLGAVFLTLLAILGLNALFVTMPILFSLFKALGAMYLIYLAYKIWKYSSEAISMDIMLEKNKKSFLRAILFGFVTQVSNPKTIIILGSIFAALLPKELPAYSEVLLCLLTFFIDCLWYCIVVVLLSTKKSQKVYLKFKKYIDRIAGSLLAVLGLKLMLNF